MKTYSNKKQTISINKRLVKSPMIQKGIAQSFKDLIPNNRYPFAIINLDIDPNEIDVNIHPQKHEVKFLNPQQLFSTLPKALQTSFMTYQKKETLPLEKISSSYSPQIKLTTDIKEFPSLNNTTNRISHTIQDNPNNTIENQSIKSSLEQIPIVDTAQLEQENTHFEYLHLYNTYLFIKTPSAIWLLDQHAVHERILYEKIKAHEEQNKHKQNLLMSEIIQLTPEQFTTFDNKILETIGFDVEIFGKDQVIINAIPSSFTNTPLEPLLLELIDQLTTEHLDKKEITLIQKKNYK